MVPLQHAFHKVQLTVCKSAPVSCWAFVGNEHVASGPQVTLRCTELWGRAGGVAGPHAMERMHFG